MRAPLNVEGDVEALIAGHTVLVRAEGNVIEIDLPGVRAGMVALRGTGWRRQRKSVISQVSAALRLADLTVQVRLAGGTIARLGAGARPGVLSRLLGLAPVEVRLSGALAILRSFWR